MGQGFQGGQGGQGGQDGKGGQGGQGGQGLAVWKASESVIHVFSGSYNFSLTLGCFALQLH